MNYFEFYAGDYLRDTGALTLAEHGAFLLLMAAYYATEKPLPSDNPTLFRLVRAMSEDEQKAALKVADMYFPVSDVDGLRHNVRADEEIPKIRARIEAARENGKLGGRPRKPKSNPVGFNQVTQQEPSGVPSTKAPHTPYPIKDKGGKPPLSPTGIDDTEAGESDSGSAIPQCPHGEILKLFAKKLPELPQPRRSLWAESKNAEALRSRWRWVMTSKHESGPRKGQPLAGSPEDGVAWFGRYFEYVRTCPLLMGKKGDWHADLGWLVNKANFAKVIQGNYEAEAA